MDKLPATCPKRVPKTLYESLRKKYWGKGTGDGRGKGGEATTNKLFENDENNDLDDTGSVTMSEMADRKGKTQMMMNSNQDEFSIKKMD